jgi:amino-acid N-acetyltransferase
MKINIRKADIKDAHDIQSLIAVFAKQDLMLSRSLIDIYENIRDYFVAVEKRKIVGCCALHICWENLAEVKALAVDVSVQNKGIGRKLVEACLKEAKALKIKKVFCLTYVADFFRQFRFKKISRQKLPHKIWTECLQCPKFPHCDEQAMSLNL